MTIRYKKKKLKINLILGWLWLAFAIIQIFILDYEKESWITYGWLLISIAYIGLYFYHYFNQYLTIENGIIKQNWPFGKKINLADIRKIRHFAGDYIVKSEKSEMTIYLQLIDEASLSDLKTELKKLNAEWY
ncbi:hypothetical protein [Lacinutrix sp. Hel_I_90]|uniref:hypothetical protein n=1 Tax=Lacinutrix sp. Hel_I_90 TaxID=1249999 RepID=UPI0005C9AA92|nr:hypothetical protein [Lacinutrix sp. Hel_I_90]